MYVIRLTTSTIVAKQLSLMYYIAYIRISKLQDNVEVSNTYPANLVTLRTASNPDIMD